MGVIAAAVTAIKGVFAGIAASAIGGNLLRIGLSVALNLLAQKLAPKPKPPGQRIGGVGTGENFPRATVLGRYLAPASLVYHNSWGAFGKTPNAYYVQVIALDDRPGATLARVAVGDKWCTLGTPAHAEFGAPVLEYRQDGRDHVWVKFYNGHQTAADPYLVAKFGTDPVVPWTSSMVGRGTAYAIVTMLLANQKAFPSGKPEVRFEIDGAGVYDPRFDSTAGGSGPQRLANPATWAQTRNPAVLAAAVARGIPMPGGRTWGGGIAVENAVVAAAATACDAQVGTPARPRFTAGLQVPLPEAEPAAVIEALIESGLGQVANIGTGIRFYFGAPEVASVSITDDDIIVTETLSEVTFPGLRETVNALRAAHPDPSRLYETVHTPERVDENALAADGRYCPQAVQLEAVTDYEQAQDICAGLLADGRRFLRHTLALPPDILLQLRPGATLAWTSARFGYSAKLFEVASVETDLSTLFGFVSLREREPGDVAPPAVTVPLPPAPAPADPPVRAIAGLAVEPHVVVDGAGASVAPGLRATWPADSVEDARQVLVRWRRQAGGGQVGSIVADAAAGEAVLAAGVAANTGYLVDAMPVINRPADWSAPVAVTSPNVRIPSSSLEAGLQSLIQTLDGWISGGAGDVPARLGSLDAGLSAEAQARSQLAADTGLRLRAIRDRIEVLSGEVTQALVQAEGIRRDMRRSLSADLGEARAAFDERIAAVVSDVLTAVQRVTALEAANGGFEASVRAVETALSDGLTALGRVVETVSAAQAGPFDAATIWHFGAGAEGWTGAPADPSTAAPGWLRPAPGSSILSPAGLALAAADVGEVRARLRRAGAPAWTGHLWWAGPGEPWDENRRWALPEPLWSADGLALVAWRPAWSGTIDRIRLDLAETPDAGAWIEADWIGIGRAEPGASTAQLTTEQLARAAADAALASQIVAVEAQITSPATGLAALGQALDALAATVSEEAGRRNILVETVRTLRASYERLVGETAAGIVDAEGRNRLTQRYLAEATQTLTTQVEQVGGNVTVLAEDVARLSARMDGAASAEVLQQALARVAEHDGTLAAHASYLVQLNAAEDAGDPATARFRMEAVAGPEGYSRIGLQTRAGSGDWRGAALFLDTPADPGLPSRVVVTGDQLVYATPGGLVQPLVASGAELRVAVPVQSANYTEVDGVPTAGYRLNPADGTIRAAGGFIGRGALGENSVSDRAVEYRDGSFLVTNQNYSESDSILLSLSENGHGEMWSVNYYGYVRAVAYQSPTRYYAGGFRVGFRVRPSSDEPWSSWIFLPAVAAPSGESTGWRYQTGSMQFSGPFHEAELRMEFARIFINTSNPNDPADNTTECHRSCGMFTQRVQR